MKKYILYVGLNDKDIKVQKISTLEAYKVACNVCKNYLEGFTISEATGYYTHENGDIVTETSLRIEVLFSDLDSIKEIVKTLKIMFNQESIAVETQTIESELM